MKNTGASSSDPKGKRPMDEADLEMLEKLSRDEAEFKRIKLEADKKGIPYEDYKLMIDLEEADLILSMAKQHKEDELLAKALAQQLEDDEIERKNRQIQEDEQLAKFLARENQEPSIQEESIPLTSSIPQKATEEGDNKDPNIFPQSSESDKTSNP